MLSDERLAVFKAEYPNDSIRSRCNPEHWRMHELIDEVERLRAELEAIPGPWESNRMYIAERDALRARNAELEDTAIRLHGAVILAASLEDTVKQLRARNAELVGVLRSVEWVERVNGVGRLYGHCPSCQRDEPRHAPDCALDAALRGEDGE